MQQKEILVIFKDILFSRNSYWALHVILKLESHSLLSHLSATLPAHLLTSLVSQENWPEFKWEHQIGNGSWDCLVSDLKSLLATFRAIPLSFLLAYKSFYLIVWMWKVVGFIYETLKHPQDWIQTIIQLIHNMTSLGNRKQSSKYPPNKRRQGSHTKKHFIP